MASTLGSHTSVVALVRVWRRRARRDDRRASENAGNDAMSLYGDDESSSANRRDCLGVALVK